MKKSLLALAVLTAVSGGAFAQSSVTLYGKIDVGGVLDSGSSAGKTLKVSTGVSGGSRIGIKGVEDLGGGMKAGFVAESGFCADGSTATSSYCTGGGFMGRQAHVDLSGAFGSIQAGRVYAPTFITLTTIDPFGTGLAGQVNNLFNAGGNFGPRDSNSVLYTTPNISGVTAQLLFGAGEVQGDWRTGRTTGGSVNYANGPIYASASFNDTNGVAGTLGTRVTNVGGTYDFGVVKASLMGQFLKAGGGVDHRNVMGGVTVPLGAGSLMASIVHVNDRSAADENATQYGIGYMYALSKRTSLYTAFAKINNQHGATYKVGNATDAGTGNKAFNLGIVHNF